MSLASGTRIGPYEVTAQIGVGGMGEVYRALDRKLQRDVAIKVLPEAFARDAERLARFEREARTLASLNHPHIAAIYGLEEGPAEAGHYVQALVMELVEGPTLADRIAQGPIPVDEALPIAKQIAEALEEAHEKGIIHRDLKPANVKVRPDGVVKVLDFGLAKALEPVGDMSATLSQSPTITTPAMTGAGMILGTAAYMAPEQARGKPVDQRADIWAFGCVLYEMLTGRRAFDGDEIADVMVAVLTREPDWGALPETTTAPVRTLLRRCLEKDRRRRVAEISTALFVLEEQASLATPQAVDGTTVPVPLRVTRLRWVLAGTLLALMACIVALAVASRPEPATDLRLVRFSVAMRAVFTGGAQSFVLSPDGRRLVMPGLRGGTAFLWVRDLDSVELRLLPGTENAIYPFWSPDSRTIGFFANGALKSIDASGGPVRTLSAALGNPRGGAWSREGVIVFASSGRGLLMVPASGGEPSPVTATEGVAGGAYRFPSFLPDGRRFLFFVFPENEIRLGSLDSTDTTKVLNADSQVQFVPQGYLLFVRQGTLLAQPFDAGRAMVTGDVRPLVEQVVVDTNGYGSYSAGENGSLAYRAGRDAGETQLTWVDRSGKVLGTAGPPGRYRNPMLSPDATRVAVEMVRDDDSNRDVWLLELGRAVLSRFTFNPRNDVLPIWSPDGARIAFGSDRDGDSFNLYQKASNGSAAEELLFKSTVENAAPYSWTPDGQFILHRYMNNGAFNTGVLPLAGDRESRQFQSGPFNLTFARVSPDGRWIVYQSNESGRYEIFAQTFPMPGGKWQVSKDGGYFARWRGDGKEIFYYAQDGHLIAVPVTSGAALELGSAVPLFSALMLNGPAPSVGFGPQYDVTPDGRRFLLNVPVDTAETLALTVVLNWAAELGVGR